MQDASTRSSHSNAYFYGFCCIKKIVLFDTLIKQLKVVENKHEQNQEEENEEEKKQNKVESLKMKALLYIEENLEKYDQKKIENLPQNLRQNIDELRRSNKDILSVLAHELGHFQHSHVLFGMLISWAHTFLFFWLFSFMIFNDNLYFSFGFDKQSSFIGLLLFSMIYQPFEHLIGFLMNFLTRHFEYQAGIQKKKK